MSKLKLRSKDMTLIAIMIALATICSFVKLFSLPMGGSVTAFSMLFIALIAYRYGIVIGLLSGLMYGLIQLIIVPYVVSLPQLIVDYLLAFSALGLGGIVSKFNFSCKLQTIYMIGVVGRFIFAVLSGIIFFGMYTPEGMSVVGYAVAYNGSYLFAEAIVTLIIISIPKVNKILTQQLNNY